MISDDTMKSIPTKVREEFITHFDMLIANYSEEAEKCAEAYMLTTNEMQRSRGILATGRKESYEALRTMFNIGGDNA